MKKRKNTPLLHLSISSPTTFTHQPRSSALSSATVKWLKALDGAEYIAAEDRFNIPLRHYREFTRFCARHQRDMRLEALPTPIISALQRPLVTVTDENAGAMIKGRLPATLYEHLYDYQKRGVAFVVSRHGRCMIADAMGVGKSIQGIGFLAVCRAEWPALLIVPSSLRVQWGRLCLKWFPDLEMSTSSVNVILKTAQPLAGQINIISYDLATRKAEELGQRKFQVILADESHYLKNRESQRGKAVLPHLARSRRLLLLTGTPALSRPAELFSQVTLLRSDIFSSFHRYGLRYCNAQKTHWGWNYNGASNLAELRIMLKATCMLRRTKDEVLGEMPPKTRERVCLMLSNKQRSIIEKSVAKLAKAKKKDPAVQQAAFLELFRTTCTAKLPSVIEYVWDMLQTGEKFLVFAHHRVMLDGLDDFLERKEVPFIRIDGSTPQKARASLVDRFQDDAECRVALLSITAAGCGLTLTAASVVVFGELFFTPGAVLQAEDRVHRVGQEESVVIKYLVASETADEKIWSMLSRKLRVVGEMLTEKKQQFGAKRLKYDEEITQTDMAVFMEAVLGDNNDNTEHIDIEEIEEKEESPKKTPKKSKRKPKEKRRKTRSPSPSPTKKGQRKIKVGAHEVSIIKVETKDIETPALPIVQKRARCASPKPNIPKKTSILTTLEGKGNARPPPQSPEKKKKKITLLENERGEQTEVPEKSKISGMPVVVSGESRNIVVMPHFQPTQRTFLTPPRHPASTVIMPKYVNKI